VKFHVFIFIVMASLASLFGGESKEVEDIANKIKKTGCLNITTKEFDDIASLLRNDENTNELFKALVERLAYFKGEGLPFNKYLFRLFLMQPNHAFFLAHVCAQNFKHCKAIAQEFHWLKYLADHAKNIGVRQQLFDLYRQCLSVLAKKKNHMIDTKFFCDQLIAACLDSMNLSKL